MPRGLEVRDEAAVESGRELEPEDGPGRPESRCAEGCAGGLGVVPPGPGIWPGASGSSPLGLAV